MKDYASKIQVLEEIIDLMDEQMMAGAKRKGEPEEVSVSVEMDAEAPEGEESEMSSDEEEVDDDTMNALREMYESEGQ